MAFKDRIKELRRVPASQLRANPKNWRSHPPNQAAAMQGVLEEIGFADAMIARETEDGLELIDGHLRREIMGDQEVPVLIVDVTEEEADQMLLTLDPLAAMAIADDSQLRKLLQGVDIQNEQVRLITNELQAQVDDWIADADIMNRITPLDASMDGHIRITFPEDLRDEVTEAVTDYVRTQGWPGVQVG